MVEWGLVEGGIRAAAPSGAVTVATDGWDPTPPVCSLPYPAEAAVAGRTAGLSVPAEVATIGVGDGTRAVTDEELGDGEFLLTADAPVETLARFRGPATLACDGEMVRLSFDDQRVVSLGFRTEPPAAETVVVPPTPAGVAAAVTVAGASLGDAGPERSRPAQRPRPPLVEFEAGAAVPDADRPLVLRVPETLESVLVAAPFAYYLGAELVTEPRDAPLLTAPSVGFERPYGALPAFAGEVATDCRRVFYMDCLARESRFDGDIDRTALSELGLEPAAVRDVSPAVRYSTYLDAPSGDVPLPPWHLSTYVEATYERARSLPYLLDRLSLVYPAEASEMEPRDLLASSLDDFYRGEVVSVSPVAPELGAGTAHAWLAPGEPVDAFKTSTRAHENRPYGADSDGGPARVELVVNDPEMLAETSVVDSYRSSSLPLSVTVRESLSTSELARVLERDADFLHFVGHCEVEGLRCPDGHLSASSLDRSGATTFFLNACGSYREGERLVEKGSVAGGVTLDRVLNEQATRVGTAFGRLLVHGFGIDRALSLARRRIMMGRDYAVIGDGTFALGATPGRPAVVDVESDEDGYAVEYGVTAARNAGATYRDPLGDQRQLYGARVRDRLDGDALASLLEARTAPVVFEGDLEWSEDLAETVRGTDAAHEP
ncbi:hypothetical protein [Halorarius halobius]|uniref:hypothetical protein n=1 Tax=Halorarius halobius TaxID=2962671 RepID=UPI0020CF58DF|nr:hypothetical protein [Halorarius halobius]